MSDFPVYQLIPGTNYTVPPDFDYLAQPIFYLLKNGTLHDPFDFRKLDKNLFYASQWSTVYGAIIGAGVMTLCHVLALTPLTKRRTLIYWLNVIGLCQVIARGVIQTLFFTRDRWFTYYVELSGDSTSVIPLHRLHSTFSVMLSLSSIATVEVIFYVQGRAILSSLSRKLYLALMSALIFFGLVAIAVRFVYAIYNLQDIWIWNDLGREGTLVPRWCEPTTLITYVITIGAWAFVWSCFIGRQIFLRWKMNIMHGKSFGAMNVLFLAGIQSMILPLFFLVMQFVPSSRTFQGAEALVVPSVLCLMPFSCLWAGTISSANGQGCDESTRVPHPISSGSSRTLWAKLFSSAKTDTDNNTARNLSGATETPFCPTTTNNLDKLYPELHDNDQIAITQTYTVSSDKSSRDGCAV